MVSIDSLEREARDYAIAAHGDQKYGEHPYVGHLDAVAEIVRPDGELAVAVAYLHDLQLLQSAESPFASPEHNVWKHIKIED